MRSQRQAVGIGGDSVLCAVRMFFLLTCLFFPFLGQILTRLPPPQLFREFKSQEVGHSQLRIDSIDVLGILSQNVNYRLQCGLSTLKAKCICTP